MRTHFQRPAHAAPWFAGISIGLFAALGIAAIAPPIPALYAGLPDGGTPSTRGAAALGAGDALAPGQHARPEPAPVAAGGRTGSRCPECGVVESIRPIARSGDTGGHGAAVGKIAVRTSGSASAADETGGNGYEITVRLRDGSRTVFKEASPRTWRQGSRVLVIGRAVAAKD